MRRIHASYIDGSSTDPPAYVTFSAILSTSEILQTRRPTADTRVCIQPPPSAVDVVLPAFAARRACSCPSTGRSAANPPLLRSTRQTDGRHIDRAVDAMRVVSITQRPACRYSAVIAYAAIISRLLFALPAWGGFLSVELVNGINVFFDVCSVLVIFSVVWL